MSSTVWIIAAAAVTALIGLLAVLRRPGQQLGALGLPDEWPLTQRAIFTAEERLLFRQLRTALPHHTILAKLPLVRFCQPTDRKELRRWFDLLSPIHVSFVVCADNGRILAALDVERTDRPTSRRVATIKQEVLSSCRVRYVKCRTDQLPSVAELQLLVPSQGEAARPVVPSQLHDQRQQGGTHATLAHSMRSRRHGAWRDSRYTSDSFFAPDGEREPVDLHEEEPMSVGLQASANRRYMHHDHTEQNNLPAAASADRWAHDPSPRSVQPARLTPSNRHSTPMPLRDDEPFRASRR
ncbi:MAG: DUF2726 domain-containing protein [Leptothrix sp. (in: b-proteobacteria)]